MLAAMRLASSFVISLAADRRRIIRIINVGKLLTVSVTHDVVVRLEFGGPRWWEMASRVSHYCFFLAAAAGGAGRKSAHGSDFFSASRRPLIIDW